MKALAEYKKGFTIVELLIVIVVIAILAAISIVAYNGIQQRARNTQRLSDIKSIQKTISLYRIQNNGSFPVKNALCGTSSWEHSKDAGCANFINPLVSIVPNIPTGPSSSYYRYNYFSAGSYGCPATNGMFYVLTVEGMESNQGIPLSDLGPCKDTFVDVGSARTPTDDRAVFFGFER